MSFAAIWRDLEIILLSEVKDKYHGIVYKWNLRKWYKWIYLQNRFTDVENNLWLLKGVARYGEKE